MLRILSTILCWFGGIATAIVVAAPPPQDDPFKAIVRPTEPRTPEAERAAFHLPPGFTMQLVAAEPDLRKPMNLAWDATGRLWLTESREYPFPAEPDQPGRDTIRIFSDFDADGRARRVEIFADGLNIPIGLYPFRSPNAAGRVTWKCVVWSIPNIWLLEDTDDDGRADRRDVLFGPLGWQRDTHGNLASFRRGLDGYVYGTHGFNNETTFVGRDGSRVDLQSGNTWRATLDGRRVEGWTRGQVNPFGLAWDDHGNLFSADCHSSPIYQLLRGGWYPSFGKPHDGRGFAPQTVRHSHNSTAICGPIYVCDAAWPAELQDHMFVCNVMTSSLNHDRIEWRGSSSHGVELSDFLTCDDPWFRPVDLSWGPDGALYVADFYNRIIGHYEVPLTHPGRDRERGRLWRIVYRGATGDSRAKSTPQPSLELPVEVAGLVDELGATNPTRRRLALDELTDRCGPAAIEALRGAVADTPLSVGEAQSRRAAAFRKFHALYGLQRLGALEEGELLAATTDADPLVRVHALRIAAERRSTPPIVARLRAACDDADPFVVRAAVEGLGLHCEAANVAPLLEAIERAPEADDHLRYAIRLALRSQFLDADALAAVDFAAIDARRRTLLFEVLDSVPTAAAAERQLELVDDLPDEAAAAALPSLAKRLMATHRTQLVELVQRRFANSSATQAKLLRGLLETDGDRGPPLDPALQPWAEATTRTFVAATMQAADGPELAQHLTTAAELVRRTGPADLRATLAAMFAHPRGDADSRAAAAAAIAAVAPDQAAPVFEFLADARRAGNERLRLAAIVAGMRTPEADAALVEILRTAGASLRPGFAAALAGSPAGAEKLIEACEEGRVPATVLRERAVADRLTAHKMPELTRRTAALIEKLPPANVEIDAAIAERRTAYAAAKPDLVRGAELFVKHCSACHAVGGRGGNISLQLDGIGTRGVERLIEDVLDPNRNVDRAFRSSVIVTSDGLVVTGLVRRVEGGRLVLAESTGKERTIATADVESRTESPSSIMPTGFNDALRGADLFDLLGYLMSTKKSEP